MRLFYYADVTGSKRFFTSLVDAHEALKTFATLTEDSVHLHPGGWAGNACSTAYAKDGDPLMDAIASVRVAKTGDEGIFVK